MLQEIKTSMRMTQDALDTEITNNIEMCKKDLEIGGVYCDESEKLMRKACELYVKWQFDYQGKGEQFESAYRKLKDAMALCGDYNVRPAD